MTAIEFEESNMVLAKDQPQYVPLPVHVNPMDPDVPVTACFELSEEEIVQIVATKRIWHTQICFGQAVQPIRMSTTKPDIHFIELTKLLDDEVAKHGG